MENVENLKFENMILKKRLSHFDKSFSKDALEALELIKQAVEKPVREVQQIDAFVNDFDSVVVPDKDGVCVFGPMTRKELRNGNCIRVQYSPADDTKKVVKALKKIAATIEKADANTEKYLKGESKSKDELLDDWLGTAHA